MKCFVLLWFGVINEYTKDFFDVQEKLEPENNAHISPGPN
jgi:hypothetical protein